MHDQANFRSGIDFLSLSKSARRPCSLSVKVLCSERELAGVLQSLQRRDDRGSRRLNLHTTSEFGFFTVLGIVGVLNNSIVCMPGSPRGPSLENLGSRALPPDRVG